MFQWPMGIKAKNKCRLGTLELNKLRHNYLNVMKLENYGPTRECLNNNKPQKGVFFCLSTLTFEIQKVQKWQTPF
jgi:hypothetical protein